MIYAEFVQREDFLYVQTLMDDETVKTLWTSDCSGSKGSALANVDEI